MAIRYQGVANMAGQYLGSILGAGLVSGLFPCDLDLSHNIGSNLVSEIYFHETFGNGPAFFGEFLMTMLLCFGA